MADEAMVRTVNSYKDLSKDVENHPVLVKDKTMVQFLAYSLSSADVEVVQLSLDTLDNLLKLEKNCQALRTVFGVSEAIKATSERNDLNETIRHHAARLYETLILSTPSRKIDTSKNSQSSDRRKLATHVTTFQIQGLYPETRLELESILVKLRGIVSVVLDVESQRCVVRSLQTVSAQAIADEIAGKTAMVPRLVLRNSQNQEFLQSIVDGDNDDNGDSLPPYLEEEYEPVKDNAISSFQAIKTNASSWLNAAASFLQNSLYW